jgi:hypothetical protein
MIRSYSDVGPPLDYSTISGRRCTFLLAEYSRKESLTSPTFLVLKVPLEVLHDSGTALLATGMYLLDPFSKKKILFLRKGGPYLILCPGGPF